jgi:hypothetical protein
MGPWQKLIPVGDGAAAVRLCHTLKKGGGENNNNNNNNKKTRVVPPGNEIFP